MKHLARVFALLLPAAAFAAESNGNLDVVVSGIPAGSSEVVVVVDTVAAPVAPNYPDPAAAPAPAAAPVAPVAPAAPAAPAAATLQKVIDQAAPAAAVDPAADPAARRRRRGGFPGASMAPATPALRQAVAVAGATTVTAHIARPVGENYRVRAIAIRDDGSLPAVLAGDHAAGIKLASDQTAPVALTLKSPALQLSADNPSSVPAGSKFTLKGTITDAAQSLGTKNRMRVWISENTPPGKNRAGTQVSTVEVTSKGDEVEFSFALTAPKTPGTLFLQFGEIPPDFAREDGTQAPLLVFPDLATGAKPFQLRVEAAPATVSTL